MVKERCILHRSSVVKFLKNKMIELRLVRSLSANQLNRLAGFSNQKAITDIESGKRKAINVAFDDAVRIAQALEVPVQLFYDAEEWSQFLAAAGLSAPNLPAQSILTASRWYLTERVETVKVNTIVSQMHDIKEGYAFSQAYYGHWLPPVMFNWWEQEFCCKALGRVAEEEIPEYMKRARDYYAHGTPLLARASFHYHILTPSALFCKAAKVEPDWVREFAKLLKQDDRIDLQIPSEMALKNAMDIIRRRTPFTQLYSMNSLDSDMAVVRQDRGLFLCSVEPEMIQRIRGAIKEALKQIRRSKAGTLAYLDKVALGKA